MKKIYLAALTLAMTACVSNDDLNPVDNYGYIDVNVSNDPIVETRAEVNDLENWTVVVTPTNSDGTNVTCKASELSTKSFKKGNYSVEAYNYVDDATAHLQNRNWGAARYFGRTENSVSVTTGGTASASIACGKAKNSRIKATFNLNTENNTLKFSDYKLTLNYEDGGRQLDIDQNNVETAKAYFSAGTVKFEFSYKFNNQEKSTIKSEITCEAGKEHIISISANENGIISLTINYDDQFENGEDATLYFDAATGDQVETPIEGN